MPYANFGNPQSLNLYTYVQNNPTTLGDPDGHDTQDTLDPQAALEAGNRFAGALTGLARMAVGTWNKAADLLNAQTGYGLPTLSMPQYENKDQAIAGAVAQLGTVVYSAVEGATAGSAANDADVVNAAREAADGAQAGGRTSGTDAALRTSDGTTYTAESGASGADHPDVQQALDNVPASQRSPFHGCCAEIKNLNQARNAEKDVEGATASAAKIRKPSNPADGQPKAPCSTCQNVNTQLGVTQ